MNIEELLKKIDNGLKNKEHIEVEKTALEFVYELRKAFTPDFIAALVEAGPERVVVLPCKVERIKDSINEFCERHGCIYDDIDLANDFGDCRKECFQCIYDGLCAEAAALKGDK